jgi:hypothetical protein
MGTKRVWQILYKHTNMTIGFHDGKVADVRRYVEAAAAGALFMGLTGFIVGVFLTSDAPRPRRHTKRRTPTGAGFAVQPCAGFSTTWWVLLTWRHRSRRRWSWRR